MPTIKGTVATAFLAVCLLVQAGAAARSQTSRTIKIVVPSPAGDTTDILARLMSEQIGRTQGVTMIVENRPGAGNQVGTESVWRAAPDGNTLLMTINSFAISAHLRKLPYDPLTGFEPICHLVNSPQLVAVNGASPFRTLADMINAAHAKPDTLTVAAVGPGTAAHIGFEMLKRAAKLNMSFVPYPGNAPAINALLGSHVTAVITGYASVAQQINTGQLRALAIGTRIPQLPDVPSVAEAGYRDVEINNWFGVVAPAKTPKETVSQLAGWFNAALKAPEVKPRLDNLRIYPVGACGADFAAHIRQQYDNYGRVIREANIKTN
jgi:tripartite-type tricarboxylate transporter receptor subunit TctC